MSPPQSLPGKVFLNIPYDVEFKGLYLAYIAGLSALGYTPRATLEIPTGSRRLDRILGLIQECDYSIHDLSRVELDRHHPRVPRFNMPFELGLSLAWQKFGKQSHNWFVFEAKPYRLAKSLSDLAGTDPLIHNGRVDGVFRELSNIFIRRQQQPTVPQMRTIYNRLRTRVPAILTATGSNHLFTANAFRHLSVIASRTAVDILGV